MSALDGKAAAVVASRKRANASDEVDSPTKRLKRAPSGSAALKLFDDMNESVQKLAIGRLIAHTNRADFWK